MKLLITILFFCIFFTECFSSKPNSEPRASHLSKITFSWMSAAFFTSEQSFERKLPETQKHLDTRVVEARIEADAVVRRRGVFWSLLRSFGPGLVFGALIKTCSDIFLFAVPQILRRFIRSLQPDLEDASEVIWWKPYFWASLLFAMTLFQVVAQNHYFAQMFRVGAQMKRAAVSLIYR